MHQDTDRTPRVAADAQALTYTEDDMRADLARDIVEHPERHAPNVNAIHCWPDTGGILLHAMCICGHPDCGFSEHVTTLVSGSSGAHLHRARPARA